MVTSDRSLTTVRDLFIEHYFDGEQTHRNKKVWVNLCIVKAVVEVVKGERTRKAELHS